MGKKKAKNDTAQSETDQSRREMLGLLGAGVAAGTIGIAPNDAAAGGLGGPSTPQAGTPPAATPGSTREALKRIINDRTLLSRLESARSGAERQRILARAGLRNPAAVHAAVTEVLAACGRRGGTISPHVWGNDDWGPPDRHVESVDAIANLVAAAVY